MKKGWLYNAVAFADFACFRFTMRSVGCGVVPAAEG
jgi:hypothetical protein